MEAKKILLVDRNPDYRDTVQEFLEQRGYQVLTASTPEEAIAVMEREYMDLAILDVRLRDSENEKDISGLLLAKQLDSALPKIILTAYPTYEVAREVLSSADGHGTSLATSFLAKQEGLPDLLKAIESVIGLPRRNLQKVFLSYSPKDKTLAQKIQATIEGSGLEVWEADHEIFPGDNWAEKTAQALKESDAMVVLLSPSSVESSNVRNDMEYALFNRRYERRLIPVVVGDPQQIPKNKIPWLLQGTTINLLENGRSEELDQIVKALRAAA